MNLNTRIAPAVFASQDADLLCYHAKRVPVLVNEQVDADP